MAKTVEFLNFRPATSVRNETAIVFVHRFTHDVEKTCRRIPNFLRDDPGFNDWDLLGVGYQSNRRFDLMGLRSSDARLEESAIMLHSRPELGRYKRLAFVARRGHWWCSSPLCRTRTCATAKHRELSAQKRTPSEAASMEEQALCVADLCGVGKANRDKLADAYEGNP